MTPPTLPRRGTFVRWPAIAVAASGGLAVALVFALSGQRPAAAGDPGPAAPPAPVVRQLELVHAETFRLGQGYTHSYRADQPLVDRGWLLVLAGDPALLQTRQTLMPVLQVGAMTAERVNTAEGSGKLVVLVPGDFRLQDAPIFLGSPALPEELRQDQIDADLAMARTGGAVPPSAERITAATRPGRTFASDYELRQRAIDLVEQYSPGEKDLIAGWRAPLVK